MAEKEYIEREAVLESISGLTWYSKNKKGVLNIGAVNRKEAYYPAGNVFDAVENVPAADVVEVVHARWDEDRYPFCNVCPVCGLVIDRTCIKYNSGKLNYCPHCGAKMDGERKEATP